MNQINYDAIVASLQETMQKDLPAWKHDWRQLPAPITSTAPPLMAQFIARIGANVVHRDGTQEPNSDNAPVYQLLENKVYLPPVEAFSNEADYLSTAFHELTHWSSHPERLKRPLLMMGLVMLSSKTDDSEFSDDERTLLELARCHEEMIAEFGSVFLCAHYGVACNMDKAASYIKAHAEWFSGAEKESIIADAVKRARKAVEWLLARNVTEVK